MHVDLTRSFLVWKETIINLACYISHRYLLPSQLPKKRILLESNSGRKFRAPKSLALLHTAALLYPQQWMTSLKTKTWAIQKITTITNMMCPLKLWHPLKEHIHIYRHSAWSDNLMNQAPIDAGFSSEDLTNLLNTQTVTPACIPRQL